MSNKIFSRKKSRPVKIQNTYNYDETYLDIYNKEKLYRNLVGYQHLIDITNKDLEFRSSTITDNIIYAPKNQVPYEFPFDILFIILSNIFKGYERNIFQCGGSALSYTFLNNYDISLETGDIDLFASSIPGRAINERDFQNMIRQISKYVAVNKKQELKENAKNPHDKKDNCKIFETDGAISFNVLINAKFYKIQLIKRLYTSPSQIIHGFDIDCSCILVTLTTREIYATKRCMFALINQYNTVNLDRLSPSYFYRLHKFFLRGLSIRVPDIEKFKQFFVTDFRNFEKLEGFLILYYKLLGGNSYINDDYDENKKELTDENINSIEVEIANPSKQINGSFQQIILDDPELLYIKQETIEFKFNTEYIPKGDIKIITRQPIQIYKQSFCLERQKRKENNPKIFEYLATLDNTYIIGRKALELFTGFRKRPKKFKFVCINGDANFIFEKIKLTFASFFIDLYMSDKEDNILTELKEPFIYKNKTKYSLTSSWIIFYFKSSKDYEFNVSVNIHTINFTNLALPFELERNKYYRIAVDSNSNFYSDSYGEHILNGMYKIGFSYNNMKNFGIASIRHDIDNVIGAIFKANIGSSFKFYTSPREIKRLYGPSVLTFYKNLPGNRRILILGETHDNKGLKHEDMDPATFDLHIWLYKLAKKSPECLDIYLERDFKKGGKQVRTVGKKIVEFPEPISSIEETFTGHSLDTVRYHMIDARHPTDSIKYPFTEIFQKEAYQNMNIESNKIELSIYSFQISDATTLNQNMETNWRRALRYISGWDTLKNKNNGGKQITVKFMEILKEGTEFNYNNTIDVFMEYFVPRIIKAIMKIKIDGFSIDKFFETLLECYLKVHDVYTSILCVPMDVYFLLRYLQSFDNLERGPLQCRNNEYKIAKNSIIHAGNSHSQIYVEFIKRWFSVQPELNIVHDYSRQHIDFDEPFDFFQN